MDDLLLRPLLGKAFPFNQPETPSKLSAKGNAA
jgi:hypothetical protein